MSELWYTRNARTKVEKGPFEKDDIARALRAKELAAETLVRREQDSAWIQLGDHVDFREGPAGGRALEPLEEPQTIGGLGRAGGAMAQNPYAAPSAEEHAAPSVAPPTMLQILFSFEGRVPRRVYWSTRGVAFLPVFAVFVVAAAGGKEASVVLIVPAYVAMLWIFLAGSIKRWHDLNKSGFWVFITMVPLVGGLWEFIEAGCSRGTYGPNKYGPDWT